MLSYCPVEISLSFLNQLTPYSIILKRNKIILHHHNSREVIPGHNP